MMVKNNRTCVVTHKCRPKEEMIRISKTKDGHYYVNNLKLGRGAYVSKDVNIIDEFINKRCLHKVFRDNVPLEIYQEVVTKIKGG